MTIPQDVERRAKRTNRVNLSVVIYYTSYQERRIYFIYQLKMKKENLG